jgi:hypothetical protein
MRYVLVLSALVLAAALFYEILNAVRSYYAARWQSTSGRLKRWDIQHDIDAEDTRIVIRNIEYAYCVAGKDYESSRIGFGFPMSMSVLYIEKILKRLLENAPEVRVFFDPANPGRSVLSVGIQLHHFVKVLGFGLVMLIAVGFWYDEP